MTYLSDSVPVQYMSDGPIHPGEDVHDARGANTAFSLAAHLLNKPAQGVGPGPGHGFEHEPVNDAERAAQHTAQTAAPNTQDDGQAPGYVLDHAQVASDVRQALRGTVA